MYHTVSRCQGPGVVFRQRARACAERTLGFRWTSVGDGCSIEGPEVAQRMKLRRDRLRSASEPVLLWCLAAVAAAGCGHPASTSPDLCVGAICQGGCDVEGDCGTGLHCDTAQKRCYV